MPVNEDMKKETFFSLFKLWCARSAENMARLLVETVDLGQHATSCHITNLKATRT
jgi:hypothetical protein